MKIWKMSRYLWLFSFLVTVLILVSGCGKEKRPELKLVTEPPYPPFEYYADEKLTGIDIDIMREIARRLDYELKIQPISFDMVMKSVASGQADAGISCITISEERKKTVDFSIPYFHVGQMVVVPAKSSIRRIENLHGKQIGVQECTTGEAYVRKKYGHAVPFPNVDVATDALTSGKVDALVLDNLPAEAIVAKRHYLRLLPEKLTEESYGIAVNKGKPALLKKINAIIADMLKTGWIDQSVKRHTSYSGTQDQEAVQSVRKLRIGIVPSYPPYESKKNGVLVGIDVDIINRICDELGYLPFFVEISSDSIYQSIDGEEITVSISSITITEERKKTVNFSIPYSETSQRILVKNKSPFRKKEDLKGKILGVVTGTTSEEQGLLISSEVERYSEPKLILAALEKDEIDGVVLDDFILKQMTMNSNKFRMLPDILTREEYGIAVSKKEPELLEKINKILLKMKQNGSLKRIHDKYLSQMDRTAK